MIQCDIHKATHVLYGGTTYRIVSKWGISANGHLAKPSDGGFGCVTEDGQRISMWEAKGYFYEEQPEPFLSMWTVYFNPTDFPGKYVARRHDILRGTNEPQASQEHFFVADSLSEIRNKLPWGLVCMTRSEGDEPQILETWL